MKRILSLALAFAVGSLGLVSLSAKAVRAQQVASAGKSLSEIKGEYERLLAIERDPATPAEAREMNRRFLEARRAQLADALRQRIGVLRKYQAGIAAALSGDEKQVVEGSIQELVAELRALQPARDGSPARATRATRRPPAAAQNQSVAAQSKQPPPEAGGGAEDGEEQPAPDPGARRSRKAAAIEITSPDADKTVHVGEVEVEVTVNDEDVDDIMVAVYTQSGGQKPATARTLELKRSDRGKKSFPVALEAGANRIEVSDLKRGEVLATRTLTYAPTRDVLNSAPGVQGTAAQPASKPSKFTADLAKANADTTHLAVICGQLQLASLNRTLALIRSTPALGDLAARFRAPEDPRRQSVDQRESAANTTSPSNSASDFLGRSQITDGCEIDNGVARDGLQAAAASDLLSAVLLRLDANLNPKPTDINKTALRDQAAYLLESTTTEPEIRAKAHAIRGASTSAGRGDRGEAGAVSQYAKLKKSSAFSSLSADTIRKQIVMLQTHLDNVDVQLTDGDNVVAQASTDHDGNYVLVFPATESTKYTLSTAADEYFTTRQVMKIKAGDKRRVNLDIEDRPVSLLVRNLIGYDQSGAAAAKHSQSYFFDFYVSHTFPFKQTINPDFGERLRLWGDFRINSVPQSGDVTIGDFAGTGFTTGIKNLKVKDVARVFEFLSGLEFRLTGNNGMHPSYGIDQGTKQKFSLSLIGAFGSVTPIDPLESAPTIFKVFDEAPGLPPAAKGKEFVAFVPSDRDRFFRQYYAGLRLQGFFFNKYNVPLQRFPFQLDVTVGQNEYVTGGRMHGSVFRMEGFFPLPYEKAKFINLFATAQMIPGRPNIGTPLILQSAPDTVTVPASNVALIAVPQPNRDHYRIGIAFDAIPLVKRILSPPVPSTPSAGSNSNNNGGGNSNNSNGSHD